MVGVWRGHERETTYDLHEGGGATSLVPSGSSEAHPGSVSVLVPPDEDIHRVENAGSGLAISVHIYGADISRLGSSINRTFPDDLVRHPAQARGPRVSWRALPAMSSAATVDLTS